MINIQNLSFQYDKESFMNDLSVQFETGQMTSIIGPNGSGKSTLLMLMCKVLHFHTGNVSYYDKDIKDYSLKEFARKVAVVHQKNNIDHDVDVETIVGYGRLPYLHYYESLSQADYDIIDWALEVTGLIELRKQSLKTLSGGQQQRVWIAMALAQKTPILLLDEPTTYLDIKYQLDILNLIQKINKEFHMTIIMVHHDLNQAIHYSDSIVAMKDGKILFSGHPKDVICEKSLQELYDCQFQIIEHLGEKIILNV